VKVKRGTKNDVIFPVYAVRYDHPHIIAGQGTVGLEIVEQVENIDAVIIPVGGGGLIAGAALAIKTLHPEIQIVVSWLHFILVCSVRTEIMAGLLYPQYSHSNSRSLGNLALSFYFERTKKECKAMKKVIKDSGCHVFCSFDHVTG